MHYEFQAISLLKIFIRFLMNKNECIRMNIFYIKIMRFAGFLHVIRVRSNLILYQIAPRPNEVDCKVHETLAFQEQTRRKPAKRIIFIQKALGASRILMNIFIFSNIMYSSSTFLSSKSFYIIIFDFFNRNAIAWNSQHINKKYTLYS